MIHYTLKNSKRAKNISIRIKQTGEVILTKPFLVPKFAAEAFLKSRQDWIEKVLASQKLHKSNKNEIWYLGKKYKIKFKVGALKIFFRTPYVFVQAYNLEAAKRALVKALKKEAQENIKKSSKKYGKKMELKYGRISIKDQTTRWGSCSSKTNLNFSWRLIMAPKKVLDYVVIHELAHLKHMDHSYRFWDLVEQFDPDFRDHRRWLKKHQSLLHSVDV